MRLAASISAIGALLLSGTVAVAQTASGSSTGSSSAGSTTSSGTAAVTGSTAGTTAGSPSTWSTACSNADPLDTTAAELGCPHGD